MDLKIRDIIELLKVNEKTVYKWIKDKKIPYYRINQQYRFNRSEINEWILSNKVELSSSLINIATGYVHESLVDLLKKGGVYSNIGGKNVHEIISNAIEKIQITANSSKEEIVSAI